MPGPLMHVGAAAMCPHGAPITTVPGSPRVLVSGMPVATLADQYLIAGCALNVSGAPSPCVRVQWIVPAARVLVNGSPAILQTSVGLCQNPAQVPQGPPVVITTQPRVVGT